MDMASELERTEHFLVANDLESEIYLFIDLIHATATLDDVTYVKSAEKPTRYLTITSMAIE